MTSSSPPNYYEILGIHHTATLEEIRQAYRKLVKTWHPDRFVGEDEQIRQEAESRIRQITEAYSVLTNPTQRTEYDDDNGYIDHRAPFTTSNTYIPGVQVSSETRAMHIDPNGINTFLGLLGILFVCIFLINILHTNNPVAVSIFTVGLLVSGGFAFVFFTKQDMVNHFIDTHIQWEPASKNNTIYDNADDNNDDDLSYFEKLVEEELSHLPDEFSDRLENVVILVESEPGISLLRRVGIEPGSILLGLYEGVSLTKQLASQPNPPERITLFQGPIERYCLFDPDRIRHQVRATLYHEMAHHFGIDHDEMPIWVKA
jgi:predicted Zn-dependent protease with MMP-like domain